MEMTLEIPDKLAEEARLLAQEEGVPVNQIIAQAMEKAFKGKKKPLSEHRKKVARLFAAMDKFQTEEPIGKFNRAEIYDHSIFR